MSVSAAVFASGSGSNLQALLDHEATSQAYRIEVVVSDRPGARALNRAETSGRRAEVIPVSNRSAGDVARDTLDLLEEERVEVVFLAGYLRLLPGEVVEAYRRRMLNIHPALLPSFGGKGMYGVQIHREVLRAGCKVTGVTIHYVDEEYDTGTVFAQWPVPVQPDDTPESLAARVLQVEHILYPLAADHLSRALAEGREPGPFSPPGELFQIAGEESDEETSRQLRRAFQGGP